MHLAAGELLIGRAWRWDAEQIAKDIDIDRRTKLAEGEEDPSPSISVFAIPHDGGDVVDTVQRLKAHVQQYRRSRWLALVTQSELSQQGFRLVLNEPPPKHYDLVLGHLTTEAAIVELEQAFNVRERMRLT
jgi:hypothetical protein